MVELQHAADVVVCVYLEKSRQLSIVTEAYETMGLTISISKTKVLHQDYLTPLTHPQLERRQRPPGTT